MQSLTPKEESVMQELRRLADANGIVTGRQLRDSGFADFVARVYRADVGYPQSLQSRKLQILRDKGHILMRNGKYTILPPPEL
jgi:hypothetical protein